MIRRQHRFHGLGSLRFVFSKGKTVRAPQCSLRYQLNPRRQHYRLAVVVSRKVHKNAVMRNRIRRRIYELVRSKEAAISQPYDLVISVYSDQVAEMPSQALDKTITSMLTKANII